VSSLLLPRLREELDLLPGPELPDGQPSWTLHDPVRNVFFQLDWPTIEMLRRWHLSPDVLLAQVNAETTLKLDEADLTVLLEFLQQNQLLIIKSGQSDSLAERLRARQGSVWAWLLHNYLFFRIPLIRPDAWLDRWHERLSFLFTRTTLHLTFMAGILGVLGVYQDWQRYSSTLVEMFSLQGAISYGLTLTAVKVLHELGHGLTAKRYGCRVPTMGVAFLVLWPVAYTDTNEVWKLTIRSQRLAVAAAGIATELGIAMWATLAWVFLPDGHLKTAAFLLSSTTWISTLLINASPFMRFDGYFLVSDALQIPNLHNRSFALARWDLRERLFALGDPVPESFSTIRHFSLILFAWATWLYRLVLFLGIAVLVYHFFVKLLGILLFLVEMVWFIMRPIYSELKEWRAFWPRVRGHLSTRRSIILAIVLMLLFVVPLPGRVMTSGLYLPEIEQVIYAPSHAQLLQMNFQDQNRVMPLEVLLAFSSPDITLRSAQTQAKLERLTWQSASSAFDTEQRRDWQLLNEQLGVANAEHQATATDARQYLPAATHEGVLRDIDPALRAGDWLAHREVIGRILGEGIFQVVAYVDEEDVRRISLGDRAIFIADGLAGPAIQLSVAHIDADATRTLAEAELSGQFGGAITVRERNGSLYPEHVIYRVLLKSSEPYPPQQHRWRGHVSIAGKWETLGDRFLRHGLGVFWREFGF
jgi:putative peptide zinc metalloprotease protein